MTKTKRTKGQTMIYKTLHNKLEVEYHEPTQIWGLILGPTGISSYCSTCSIHCNIMVTKNDEMSCMKKRPDCNYDKRNISVVICDTIYANTGK